MPKKKKKNQVSSTKTPQTSSSSGGLLVIVESPTKAKTISKFLNHTYTVVSSMGHIVELADKKMNKLVANNFEPVYAVPSDKVTVVKHLKSLKKQAIEVILATDEDREGEAISRHLCQQLGLDPQTVKRIVFHEITEAAIKHALEHPRTIDMDLVYAQQARAVLDRLVGFTVSPILRVKIKHGLSAGRVQSVAVKLVVERENEISTFVSKEYWTAETLGYVSQTQHTFSLSLKSIFGSEVFQYQEGFHDEAKEYEQKSEKGGTFSHEVIKHALMRLGGDITTKYDDHGHSYVVCSDISFVLQSITSKQTKKSPSTPFITSSLQQTASRQFGRSVKQVMQIAQRLYEHGLITYMRTDSTILSTQAIAQCKDYIIQQFGKAYSQPRQFSASSKNAQEAHEAIRPTSMFVLTDQIDLGSNEQKLYQLIRQRTMASQMADAKFQLTSYSFSPQVDPGQTWVANGKVVVFDGYLKLSGGEQEDTVLPTLKQGDIVRASEIFAIQHFTKPPARYTEATLVKALESMGIGRPSTYASIIQTIQERGYVNKEAQSLVPTPIAFAVVAFLSQHFKNLMNYDFTAELEDKLDSIARGELVWKTMLGDFWRYFQQELDASHEASRVRLEAGKPCPKCGGALLIKTGKKGNTFIGCEHFPECDYVSETDDVMNKLASLREAYEGQPCPEGGTIVVKMGRFGPFVSSSLYPKVKRIKSVKQFELDRLVATMNLRLCPTCHQGQLVLKSSKRGVFWACNRYPDCTHAEKFVGDGGDVLASNKKKVVRKKSIVKK